MGQVNGADCMGGKILLGNGETLPSEAKLHPHPCHLFKLTETVTFLLDSMDRQSAWSQISFQTCPNLSKIVLNMLLNI